MSGEAIDAGHLAHQREWSTATFGPGFRAGVVDHIRKELVEIEADPLDLAEWVDVIILGFDGAWRAGHEPQAIIDAIKGKQARNEARTWPDWRTMSSDKAIEHDRSADNATPPLVAAPPVPPVVPDSEALDPDDAMCDPEDCDVCEKERGDGTRWGVVPDKPALALCPDCGAHASRFPEHNAGCPNGYYADVPAVTDDEAATEVIALALNDNPVALNNLNLNELALDVVAALRSAGFLIVHHTKET